MVCPQPHQSSIDHHRLLGIVIPNRSLIGYFGVLEMLEASQEGDNRNVDMLVGDIYGTDYSKVGLKSSTIASSMGKVFKKNVDKRQFKPEDISRSLLYMVR